MPPIHFKTKLLSPVATDGKKPTWSFLRLPEAASKKLPTRSQVSVEGTINAAPLIATLDPDGQGGHWLKVDHTLRLAANAEVGDTVELDITPATVEPEPKVPPAFRTALAAAAPKAREIWADITPTARRDWIFWITSAKQAETRARRITTACDMLAKGKRRACCFDRSGLYSKSLTCPVADNEHP